MEQVRLCTVCPIENWLGTSKTTYRFGWMIQICYSRALERRCLPYTTRLEGLWYNTLWSHLIGSETARSLFLIFCPFFPQNTFDPVLAPPFNGTKWKWNPLSERLSHGPQSWKQVPDLIDLRRPLEGDFLGFEFGHFARCEKITNFLSSGELRSLWEDY